MYCNVGQCNAKYAYVCMCVCIHACLSVRLSIRPVCLSIRLYECMCVHMRILREQSISQLSECLIDCLSA